MILLAEDVTLIELPQTHTYYCSEKAQTGWDYTENFFKELNLDQTRADNAKTIIKAIIDECNRQGKTPEEAKQAAIIALSVAMQESGLVNIEGKTYKGLFQQDSGWGTLEERMNPEIATIKFAQQLLKLNFINMQVYEAAQAVQRSAHPQAYSKHVSKATFITNFLCE